MIGFFIKKTFFDLWDNLISIVLINLGFLLVLAVPIGLPLLFAKVTVLVYATLVVGCVLFFVYAAAVSCAVREIACYRSFGFREFFGFFAESWKVGVVFGLLIAALGFLCGLAIPFYLSMKSFLGLFAASLIFWTAAVLVLALQYFFPLYVQLDHNFKKSLRKSFILFFDNPLFTFFLFIHNIVIFAISIFLALLVPGCTGILLAQNEAFKLRMYKYDYLEENPDANRRHIPWGALLYDEREKVGSRSFRNFIFPWKD
jgi:uncharacterized membrane protein YesL